MPNRPQRDTPQSTDNIPPDRHHGGQELPDDVQDRPEQNAGYDAAVKGEPASRPFVNEEEELEDLDLTDLDEIDNEEHVDPDEELPH